MTYLAASSGPPPLQLLGFVLSLLAVSFSLHFYLAWRLVGSTPWRERWYRRALAAAVALGVFVPVSVGGARLLGPGAGTVLAWTGYVWMGTVFYLFVWTVVGEPVRAFVALRHRWTSSASGAPPRPDRRRMIGGVLGTTAAVGASLMSVAGVSRALRPHLLRRIGVPIAGLDARLEGFTIAHLTDIHVGPTIARTFVERVVAATNRLQPDVIVITGDLVDGTPSMLAEHVAPLADLRARYGVFFCTGNHEYYSGVRAWMEHLPTLGIRVLRNENVVIEHEGARLRLAGVDDHRAADFGDGHGADYEAAAAGRLPEEPLILLAHQPIQVEGAARVGVDLQLSGHTHGGQIRPFDLFVPLQQPYTRGLVRHDDTTWIYVSCGTGWWGPPMRVGAPQEIAIVELLPEGADAWERDEGLALADDA